MFNVRFIAIVALSIAVLSIAGCRGNPNNHYQGYAEGEFVLVAAPFAGRLEKLGVQRGQAIDAGALLFVLEQENETAARKEALARLQTAEARHANLAGALRSPEIETFRAEVARAEADFNLSALQRDRQEKLYAAGVIARAQLDETRALYENRREQLAGARAKLESARSSLGRAREIDAAQAEVEAARAVVEQSEWRLSQREIHAPVQGLVQDTFYSQGEWVPPGSPVVSLLPPENIRIRFFVPETVVGALSAGRPVTASCDGCSSPVSARISFISPHPEYTPPVIYSREQRAKLVFLVEAEPEPAGRGVLRPGQPVDVELK